jgi:hypothetical protein
MGCIRFGLKYEMARAMAAPTKQAYLQKSNSNGRRIKSNTESVGDSGTDNYRGLTVLRITKLAGEKGKMAKRSTSLDQQRKLWAL